MLRKTVRDKRIVTPGEREYMNEKKGDNESKISDIGIMRIIRDDN